MSFDEYMYILFMETFPLQIVVVVITPPPHSSTPPAAPPPPPNCLCSLYRPVPVSLPPQPIPLVCVRWGGRGGRGELQVTG